MLLDLDEIVCPHCRTPRDDKEIEAGLELVRNAELKAKKRPKLAAAGLAAVLFLTVAWLARRPIGGAVASVWGDFAAEVERTRQPGHWKKAPEPLASAPAAPAAAPEVVVSSFVYLNTSAVADAPPPEPAAPADVPAGPPSAVVPTPIVTVEVSTAPVEAPPWPGQVRVHGLVYDLATKRPVRDVRVQFIERRKGPVSEATTDAAGRYQADLYKNASDAVAVMIDAPGYRKGLLEDRDPPYSERSSGARADVIAETIDSDLDPVPLRYRESAQLVQLDLVLVPQEKK